MKSKDHYERMGRLCEELKRISQEYGICILLPAQAPPVSQNCHLFPKHGIYIIDYLNHLAPCSHPAWDWVEKCKSVRCAYCHVVIPATEEHRKHLPFRACSDCNCAQCNFTERDEENT